MEFRKFENREVQPIFLKSDIENFIESEIQDCIEDLGKNKKINFKIRSIEAARFICNLDKTLNSDYVLRKIRIEFFKRGWI